MIDMILPTVTASEEWNTLCMRTLNEEQIDMLHMLLDMQSATATDEMRAAYKVGFKDGVALMREVQE